MQLHLSGFKFGTCKNQKQRKPTSILADVLIGKQIPDPVYTSNLVQAACEGKPLHCSLQTQPCCSPSLWEHTRCPSGPGLPRRWSPSLHSDAAMVSKSLGSWCRPTWHLLVAGIQQKSATPEPSPEASASIKTAGHKLTFSECQWLEPEGLLRRKKETEIMLLFFIFLI